MLANVTYIIPHQDLYADEILSAADVINHTTGDARDWTSIQLAGRVLLGSSFFNTMGTQSRFPGCPLYTSEHFTPRETLCCGPISLPFRFISNKIESI
jgi:hypothetical protein